LYREINNENDHITLQSYLEKPGEMGIRLGNAFQCQKVLYSNYEEEEPPLLYIKQLNPGTSTIKPLPRTTNTIKLLPRTTNSRRPQMEGTYKQHL
jgi:hypothetical protein